MQLSRRGFLFGAGATIAVVRTAGLLMPVKSIIEPPWRGVFDLEAVPLPPGVYSGRMVHVGPNWQQLTRWVGGRQLAHANFDEVEKRVLAMTIELDNGHTLKQKVRQ